jgi:hypothetical protein
MTPEQRAAYVQAQCICALADIEAMKAENAIRAHKGAVPAYNSTAFYAVQSQYMISHNDVIAFFRD